LPCQPLALPCATGNIGPALLCPFRAACKMLRGSTRWLHTLPPLWQHLLCSVAVNVLSCFHLSFPDFIMLARFQDRWGCSYAYSLIQGSFWVQSVLNKTIRQNDCYSLDSIEGPRVDRPPHSVQYEFGRIFFSRLRLLRTER